MRSRNAVVLDLDDTLYMERDFVSSGFRAVGAWLFQRFGCTGFVDECEGLFEAGQRANIFDDALNSVGLRADAHIVRQMVQIYRSHAPEISLLHDSQIYLNQWSGKRSMAIITDGIEITQRAKVGALLLENYVDYFVYTGSWGVDFYKPHPRGFEAVEAWFDVPTTSLVYVADNPAKDFFTPRARGWWTVRIARPGRLHCDEAPDEAHEAHLTVESLLDLDVCLPCLDSRWAR